MRPSQQSVNLWFLCAFSHARCSWRIHRYCQLLVSSLAYAQDPDHPSCLLSLLHEGTSQRDGQVSSCVATKHGH